MLNSKEIKHDIVNDFINCIKVYHYSISNTQIVNYNSNNNMYNNSNKPLSIYDSNSSIETQISYLRFYETTYNKTTGLNSKLEHILSELPIIHPLQYYIDDAILFIRNIHLGRGERELTYSLLYTIQKHSIERVIYLLKCMIYYNFQHPMPSIGCWKDVRNYAEFIYKYMNKNESASIIKIILQLYSQQLVTDREMYMKSCNFAHIYSYKNYISYAAKYAPRERNNSKYYLYESMFESWCELDPECKNILKNALETNKYNSAVDKCKIILRKTMSQLNTIIDTIEVKMCANKWNNILAYKIPRNALIQNKDALIKRNTQIKNYIDEMDKSATTYKTWEIIKYMLKSTETEEIQKWNIYWENQMKTIQLEPMYYVPLLDVYPIAYEGCNKNKLYKAYAAAIVLAQKSLFGKKILLTYLNKNYWVDITNCSLKTIIERLQCIIDFNQTAHNPANSLLVVLGAAINGEFTAEEVQQLRILFISPTELTNEQFDYYRQQWEMGGIQSQNQCYELNCNNFEKIVLS